jgi:hypothetical protein
MEQLNTNRRSELAIKPEFHFLYSFYHRLCLRPGPLKINFHQCYAGYDIKSGEVTGLGKKESGFAN